jgi:hypothetical protein
MTVDQLATHAKFLLKLSAPKKLLRRRLWVIDWFAKLLTSFSAASSPNHNTPSGFILCLCPVNTAKGPKIYLLLNLFHRILRICLDQSHNHVGKLPLACLPRGSKVAG